MEFSTKFLRITENLLEDEWHLEYEQVVYVVKLVSTNPYALKQNGCARKTNWNFVDLNITALSVRKILVD